MNLEDALEKVAELSREELHIVRKRAEENTAARNHGEDFHQMQDLAKRLDEYAVRLRSLHDSEFDENWREKA